MKYANHQAIISIVGKTQKITVLMMTKFGPSRMAMRIPIATVRLITSSIILVTLQHMNAMTEKPITKRHNPQIRSNY